MLNLRAALLFSAIALALALPPHAALGQEATVVEIPAAQGKAGAPDAPRPADEALPDAAKDAQAADQPAPKALPEAAKGEEVAAPVADSSDKEDKKESQMPLDLALKGISLSQGESGFEIWRLKAEWASLEKTDDTVVTQKPRLTYFMKDGDNTIQVEAEQGEVNQKTQILRFIDSVRASQDDKQLSGALLVYNGNDKTMSMPEGGKFTASGIAGSCQSIVWHIDDNIIEASGRVTIFMETASPPGREDNRKVRLDKLTEGQLASGSAE